MQSIFSQVTSFPYSLILHYPILVKASLNIYYFDMTHPSVTKLLIIFTPPILISIRLSGNQIASKVIATLYKDMTF